MLSIGVGPIILTVILYEDNSLEKILDIVSTELLLDA